MSSGMPVDTRRPRLNPFIFPSDTDFRFILLIISVLGASLFAYHTTSNYVLSRDFVQVTSRCSEAANAAYPGNPAIDTPEGFQRQQLIANCLRPYNLNQSAWIAGGVGLLLVVTVLLYWMAPAWKIWRERLAPLSADDAPEVVAYLEELCREVGLHDPPTCVWNPLNPAKSGLAFGRIGHYYVALPGGLVTLFYADRPTFRAVMLHELAHLKNADIDKTYFAVAVWQAFVAVASIPFIGLIIYLILKNPSVDEASLGLLDMAWRMVPLAALVYLMRNAVLRTREIYADVRASVWDSRSGALAQVLATLPSPKQVARRIGLSVHPEPNERRQMLAEPHRLFFRLGFWDALATGVAAAIAVPNMALFLSLLLPFQQAILEAIVPAVLTAPLVIGILGVGVWRSSFAVLWGNKIPHNIGRLGVGLGFGLMLGYALSFDSASLQSLLPKSSAWGFYAVLGFMALPVSLFCFLFLRWMAAGALAWLESATTRRSLSRVSVPGYVVAGIVLATCLGVLFVLLNLVPFIVAGSDQMLLSLIPLMLFLICVPVLPPIVIYPLAAVFRRRQASVDMQWAFLDDLPQPLALPRLPPLRPRLALFLGLISGALFLGLMVIIRIGLHLALPDELRHTSAAEQSFLIIIDVLAILMQVVLATLVAIWVQRMGWAHGMFAAFVAGCVMTMTQVSLYELGDCIQILSFSAPKSCSNIIDLAFISSTAIVVIIPGALCALPVAIGAAAVAGWGRRFLRVTGQ